MTHSLKTLFQRSGKILRASVKIGVMLRHQESKLGVTVAWLLGPAIFALVGFYLGTIWASPSDLDLQYPDIRYGFMTALIGLAIGVAIALAVTIFYPPVINREYDHPAHGEHH